jgi:hypothetical protein
MIYYEDGTDGIEFGVTNGVVNLTVNGGVGIGANDDELISLGTQ